MKEAGDDVKVSKAYHLRCNYNTTQGVNPLPFLRRKDSHNPRLAIVFKAEGIKLLVFVQHSTRIYLELLGSLFSLITLIIESLHLACLKKKKKKPKNSSLCCP